MTLIVNPRRARTQNKLKLKAWSVGSEDKLETNGRTDGRTIPIDCFSFLANAIGNDEGVTTVRLHSVLKPTKN